MFVNDDPVVAEGAPVLDKAYIDEGDEIGHVFGFSNASGFGLRNDKSQGHFKVWSLPNSNGEHACCLVPSKDSFMMLGKHDQRFDRIFADKFVGTIDKAKALDIPLGWLSYPEGAVLENGLYLFRFQDRGYSECRFQAVITIDNGITDKDIIYLGDDTSSNDRYQAKIETGKVTMVRTKGTSTTSTNITGSNFWVSYKKIS